MPFDSPVVKKDLILQESNLYALLNKRKEPLLNN